LYYRHESAAASFKACLQSYLSPDMPTADDSRESSPLHMTSARTPRVTLLQKNQELNARDANVVSYMVHQVSLSDHDGHCLYIWEVHTWLYCLAYCYVSL